MGIALVTDVPPRAPKLALWAAAATGVQVGAAIVASRLVVAEVPRAANGKADYKGAKAMALAELYRPFLMERR